MQTRCTDGWRPRPPGPAPAGTDLNEAFANVHWHQRWQVFQGVYTPGRNPVELLCDYVGLPADLRGKRVLDIGAWNGCFSFECERRGAAEVVALSLETPEESGFARLKALLGSQVVRFEQQSIYTAEPGRLGEFDVVLFLGVLYHLRYPLLAVDRIRNLCRGTALVETHVIDDCFLVPERHGLKPYPLQKLSKHLPGIPTWRFYKGKELGNDSSNWFGPNIQAVIEAFESAGFTTALTKRWADRASFTARVTTSLSDALVHTYEAYRNNQQFVGVK